MSNQTSSIWSHKTKEHLFYQFSARILSPGTGPLLQLQETFSAHLRQNCRQVARNIQILNYKGVVTMFSAFGSVGGKSVIFFRIIRWKHYKTHLRYLMKFNCCRIKLTGFHSNRVFKKLFTRCINVKETRQVFIFLMNV